MAPFQFIFSGFIVHSVSERIKCARLLPFQRFHGDTNFPKDGFGQSADSGTQQRSGDFGVEILDTSKNIVIQLRHMAAAVKNHVADTFADCFLKPSGDAAIVQLFQEAVLFVVQQVGKVILSGFLRKLLGKRLYNLTEIIIGIQQELIL